MVRILVMIIAFVGAAAQAWATDMTLTVTAGGKQSVYSVEDLESLGTQGFETTTSWTDGPQFFEGVLLSDIARAHGIETGVVAVAAINGYEADIDVAEILAYPVLLATRMNGERMAIRDKGPFWVVYPRDDFPELADEQHNFKWVWQVSSLEFR
ncbi:MAG: hypothetical protein CMJ42_01550 [Phyllobacteriaceae bacterium]|nr:hypothetical protein [Phyllobacteriaceae bacterium]MBA90482.1 hypothetical protein [Phyllobacteriaceae bacterium]